MTWDAGKAVVAFVGLAILLLVMGLRRGHVDQVASELDWYIERIRELWRRIRGKTP